MYYMYCDIFGHMGKYIKKYASSIAIKHKLLYNFPIRETIYIGGAY